MKLYQDRDWLEQKYWGEGLSIPQIAKEINVHKSTIGRGLKKFAILRDVSRGQFKEGNIPWDKGKHHSEETKRKIGIANKGNKAFLGRKHTEETKEKLRKIPKPTGKNNPLYKPRIEKVCLYCGLIFYVIPSRSDEAKYCNKKCQHLAMKGKAGWNKGLTSKTDNRILSGKNSGSWKGGLLKVTCTFCGQKIKKELNEIKGHKWHFCNRKCHGKYLKKLWNSDNKKHPSWKGGKIKRICKQCGKEFEIFPAHIKKGGGIFCSYACHIRFDIDSGRHKGKKNPMYGVHRFGEASPSWKGGLSFEPYGLEFNNKLRGFIRKRDNYQCQKCEIKENGKAHICHHIDYDKKNNQPENFILLCNSCHSKTNSNRQYWQSYFIQLIDHKKAEFYESR